MHFHLSIKKHRQPVVFFKHLVFLWILLASVSLASCEKPEGEGGSSTIEGRIMIHDYNYDFTELVSSYPAQEEDVYIVYGDDDVYNDRFKTHFDGSFRFEYLHKGTYHIYAYSKDSTFQSLSGKIPVSVEVEITENRQEMRIPDIIILK